MNDIVPSLMIFPLLKSAHWLHVLLGKHYDGKQYLDLESRIGAICVNTFTCLTSDIERHVGVAVQQR